MDQQQITEAVRSRYSSIARQVTDGTSAHCCDTTPTCCGETSAAAASGNTISQDLYTVTELDGLPLKAALASLGCGNPTALADLRPGETVLDLGSGGGIDVLLSARRVGPEGLAYGLDMTDEMLDLARHNAAEAGVENVRWLKGDIASIPLPDASVDIIISNCVINLAADKQPVFAEAFRVLKPGGRFAVSDVVIHGGLPVGMDESAAFRRDLSSWSGCIAGALTDAEYRAGLAAAGFTAIDLEITRRYTLADVGAKLPMWAQTLDTATVAAIISRFASTFVRAHKP
ncbi:MAG: arsenite methyltransferase [Chloroflexaceae bacterium]|nr:arsenite methyltransferase [Chloroflexaceae bacterium]NJO05118.1 arsenite methyltransferase [Chloroflexaceae bacterium]